MSFNVNWDIEKYREEYESEDHWNLRKRFMERWKQNYPEERLVCLARAFTNIEFMGCRYPPELMKEIANLSKEVAKGYRDEKKTKLQRTFVSASDAAEDRAKGVKREGGVIKDTAPSKYARSENNSSHINFVKPEDVDSEPIDSSMNFARPSFNQNTSCTEKFDREVKDISAEGKYLQDIRKKATTDLNKYLDELNSLQCIDVSKFRDGMFNSCFGRLVLLLRPWATLYSNLQASCQACKIELQTKYENHMYMMHLNGKLLAEAQGDTKVIARTTAETLAWNRIKKEVLILLIKEQFIAQGESRISVNDVSSGRKAVFGTPVENSIASKMMKIMGWKGGGLGADSQGIAEPIKPHLQMVNRAGLGSTSSDIREMKRAAQTLMQRYLQSDTFDVDLVFSNDFSKEERAALHQCAQRSGLISKSYGQDTDRFLVVKKRLNPFSLVKAVVERGGNTPKYQVFIPVALSRNTVR